MVYTLDGQAPRPGSLQEAFDTGRMNRKAWIITIMLILFQIIAFADKAVLGLVASKAIPELGISAVQFGFIGSAFFFLYAVVSVVTGFIASRVSVKWILFAMGTIWALMQFPMLFGGGAAALLVTRIILGGAEGPATAMSLSSAHGWFKASERALPSNLIAIGSTLGPVIAAPALAFVIVTWGWRWAFGVLGVVGLLWLVAWWIIGADGPFAPTKAGNQGSVPATTVEAERVDEKKDTDDSDHLSGFDSQRIVPIWSVLLSGTFLVAVLGGFTNFWTQGFLTTWLPKYLGGAVGLSLEQVGVITTFPWVFGALVLLALGFLGRKLMRSGKSVRLSIAVPFGISLVIAGLCFSLVPQTSGTLSVVLLTIGAGCSVIYPMAPSAIAYAVGPKQRPILMATLGGVASTGAIVSPTLVGWLMERAGYQTPAKGAAETTEMVSNMVTGVNDSFALAGGLLIIGGLLALLFMNPDRTAAKLQRKYHGAALSA
jgi:MFS family permease